MKTPHFNPDGIDATTFHPFILRNAMDTEWADVRLEFSNWTWSLDRYGDSVDDYYLNGPGVEGLVKAVRFANGLEVDAAGIHYNSEGDTCYIHFESMDEATQTATLAAAMISSIITVRDAIKIAERNGWGD